MARELLPGPRPVVGPLTGPEAQLALDAALGTVVLTLGAVVTGGRAGAAVVAPVARFLWSPPLVPRRLQPRSVVHAAARRGRSERGLVTRRLLVLLDVWTPAVVEALVSRLDLTRLVEEHVDLDALVATVDLDAAVARVDLDAAVARVDLDAAVARVDLDAAVERVDVDAVVRRVAIDAILERIDIDAIVAGVDLDAVIDRLDLAGIVGEVLDEIDLPAIIRDSTGSMASETVRGVRMTGISADDAISRAVDRALFRRRRSRDHEGTAP